MNNAGPSREDKAAQRLMQQKEMAQQQALDAKKTQLMKRKQSSLFDFNSMDNGSGGSNTLG